MYTLVGARTRAVATPAVVDAGSLGVGGGGGAPDGLARHGALGHRATQGVPSADRNGMGYNSWAHDRQQWQLRLQRLIRIGRHAQDAEAAEAADSDLRRHRQVRCRC